MKKSVIVTGASRGIGKACAIEFAKNGYDVLCCYKEKEEEAKAVQEKCILLGSNAKIFKMDLANAGDCKRAVSKCMMEYGKVDALVCNGGVSLPALFTETTEEDYDSVMDVNVKGNFFLSRAAAKEMITSGSGSIVFLSSIWGIAGAAMEVAYSVSKAAVIGLTRSLSKELAPSHIRVNCIAPGVIDTDMNRCHSEETMETLAAKTPLSRIGTPEEVAKAVFFLASDHASFITGQVLTVDGGFLLQ